MVIEISKLNPIITKIILDKAGFLSFNIIAIKIPVVIKIIVSTDLI